MHIFIMNRLLYFLNDKKMQCVMHLATVPYVPKHTQEQFSEYNRLYFQVDIHRTVQYVTKDKRLAKLQV